MATGETESRKLALAEPVPPIKKLLFCVTCWNTARAPESGIAASIFIREIRDIRGYKKTGSSPEFVGEFR
jgi:hypothetical protein